MSEMSFEQMLDETFKTIHNGEVLEGKVISVRPDEAVLNIGYKADGILTSNEYSNTPVDLTTVISVGDELTVKVLKVNDGEGQVALSYKKLAAEKANKRIEEAFENKEVLKAPVVQILKGGLSVDVEGGRVFIPASLVSDAFERDLDKYLNQEIEFVVTEFNPKKRRIIGDRKQLIVAEKEAAKKHVIAKVLIEVNVGREESKFGFLPEELDDFVEKASDFSHIQFMGLMTSAPFVDNPEENRPIFAELRKLSVDIARKNAHNMSMSILSMGMTNDYEIAVEEGATMVSVGTAIFGERNYNI